MTARLATVAPDLVPRLDTCSEDELRDVVAVVVREAVARSGLDDPAVWTVLGQIGAGDSAGSATAQEVAARLDEEAWEIQESDEGDSPRYLAAFQRARAASAVAFAVGPDRAAALESIYEAQAALGSIDEARRLIEPLLAPE